MNLRYITLLLTLTLTLTFPWWGFPATGLGLVLGSPVIRKLVSKKTRDHGLQDGEIRMILRSLVLSQYRRVTDGRTDRRTRRQ